MPDEIVTALMAGVFGAPGGIADVWAKGRIDNSNAMASEARTNAPR